MKHQDQLAIMTIDVTAAEIRLIEEIVNWMGIEGCDDATGQFTVDIRPYGEILDLLRPGVSDVPQKFAGNLLQIATRLMSDAKSMADEDYYPFEDCESRVELAQKLEMAAGRSTETPTW